MIEVRVDKRSKEVMLRIPKLAKEYPERIEQALYDIGDEVVKETRRLIKSRNKTGRIYSFRGRPHQASAPGESPANRTGRLLKSSNYKVRNAQEMSVGESAFYAKFLEDGTKKMVSRQHLIRAINNKGGVTYKILEAAGRPK